MSRLALTKADARPLKTIARTWATLYEWLGTVAHREWPDRLRAYLRAAEIRLAREEYLTEGTLTRFVGFQFSDDNPYTYGEGKRLLKLAIAELRKDRTLRALGMDPKAPGRSAITGRGARSVWDFLSLKDRPKHGSFTSYPHLTLSVQAEFIEIAVTIPNGVTRTVRQRLVDLGVDGLIALNEQISKRTRRIVDGHGWCGAYALQRHYLSQRSIGIMDARLTFKLETSQRRGRSAVKRRSEWVETFAALLRRKGANIQFGYTVQLWWGDVPELASRKSLQLIVDSWCAMGPLLDVIRGVQRYG